MTDDYFYSFPNRTVCSVLESMRKCYETRNFAGLLGMIEECQYLANKMEAALSDKADIREWSTKREELKREMKGLKKELAALKTEKAKLVEPND